MVVRASLTGHTGLENALISEKKEIQLSDNTQFLFNNSM